MAGLIVTPSASIKAWMCAGVKLLTPIVFAFPFVMRLVGPTMLGVDHSGQIVGYE